MHSGPGLTYKHQVLTAKCDAGRRNKPFFFLKDANTIFALTSSTLGVSVTCSSSWPRFDSLACLSHYPCSQTCLRAHNDSVPSCPCHCITCTPSLTNSLEIAACTVGFSSVASLTSLTFSTESRQSLVAVKHLVSPDRTIYESFCT